MATNRFFDNTGLTVSDGTLAKAIQLNNLSSETNKAFEVVESEIDVIGAAQSLANKWANDPQGTEPEPIAYPGAYSARANAEEAEAWASGTAGVDTEADGVTTITYSAKEKADEAAASASAASSSASAASTSESNALTYRNEAEGFKDDAETAETNASASASSASGFASAASTSASNASTSETNAQLRAWEAEAEKKTAESYATEAEDTFVNVWTSDGDGTFTATPTTDYSALHWKAKAEAVATPPATGQDTFAGNGNTKTVAHGLGGAPSGVTVTAAADPGGYLGEVWVTWDATNLYVGNSGSFTGAFTYVAYQ